MLCSVRSSRRCHGFTLMQVLATVAGIAAMMMIGIILFSPCRSRQHARRAICQSNLKQIGLGMMQYMEDYDHQFPRLAVFTSSGTVGPSSIVSWRQAIDPYIKSKQVYQCPSNPIRDSVNATDSFPQSYDVADCGPIRLNQAISVDKLPFPALTITVFEENGDTPQAQQIGALWDHDADETGWTNILFGGHLTGANYLFVDGHVKFFRPMQTIADGINRWHLDTHNPVSSRAMEKLRAAERNFPE